jgi:hypothetical protein
MYLNKNVIKTVPANFDGRDFLIGDLHGCFDELMKLLNHVKFDENKDRLFSTGDLIDRGPKSYKALELLKKDWFFSVLGNHEDILLNKINQIKNDDIQSFSVEEINYIKELTDLIPYVYNMPLIIEMEHLLLGSIYIVHSEILPEHLTTFSSEKISSKEYERYFNAMKLYDFSNQIKLFIERYRNQEMPNDLRQKILWSRKIITSYYKENKENILNSDFSFIEKRSVKTKIKIFGGHNIVPFPMKIGQQYYLDTGAALGYSDKELSSYLFETLGHEFFTLSMADLYTGICYGCITSPKDRGKILKFEKSIYQ